MTVHRKCSIHARRNHLQDRDGTGAREEDDDACCTERSGISSLPFDKSDDSKDGIEYRFRILVADFMHQKVTYGKVGQPFKSIVKSTESVFYTV
jgi:hypothetical protein